MTNVTKHCKFFLKLLTTLTYDYFHFQLNSLTIFPPLFQVPRNTQHLSNGLPSLNMSTALSVALIQNTSVTADCDQHDCFNFICAHIWFWQSFAATALTTGQNSTCPQSTCETLEYRDWPHMRWTLQWWLCRADTEGSVSWCRLVGGLGRSSAASVLSACDTRMMMMMMIKLPILPCAEKLELVLSTAPKTWHNTEKDSKRHATVYAVIFSKHGEYYLYHL